MSGTLAVVELILVFAGVLGWGFYELRSLKRARREADKPRRED